MTVSDAIKAELLALKAEVRKYGITMLDEAEHAADIGADELRFAAVTSAAVAELIIRKINNRIGKLPCV